jgi:hypothetical protein
MVRQTVNIYINQPYNKMPLSFLIQTLELLWSKRMSKHCYTCILEPTISFSLSLSLDKCEVHHQRIEIVIK